MMGTTSTIKFIAKSKNGEEIPLVNIYQQYDGYIDSVGKELARWLMNRTIVNGIRLGQTSEKFSNGVGCLAAQFIRDYKESIGDLYIVPLDISKEYSDYNYEVVIDDFKNGVPLDEITLITITNFDYQEPIFTGKPSELLEFTEYDV